IRESPHDKAKPMPKFVSEELSGTGLVGADSWLDRLTTRLATRLAPRLVSDIRPLFQKQT
ncbi:hypothetical protein E2562_037201, partial [Oryza meyeriana var. granulata]